MYFFQKEIRLHKIMLIINQLMSLSNNSNNGYEFTRDG